MFTENNKLGATCVHPANTTTYFSTEIFAGVSELCWVDVEVTRHVCNVFFCTDSKVVVDDPAAVVDEVVRTVTKGRSGRHTETVVPV